MPILTIPAYGRPWASNTVTLSRLHLSVGGPAMKIVHVVIAEPGAENNPEKMHIAVVREEHFLAAVRQLYGDNPDALPPSDKVGQIATTQLGDQILRDDQICAGLEPPSRRAVWFLRRIAIDGETDCGITQSLDADNLIAELCVALGEDPQTYEGEKF